MLPMRCNQPPCRNIEVSGVYQWRSTPRTHVAAGLSGTAVPGRDPAEELRRDQPQLADRPRERRVVAHTLHQDPDGHVRGDEREGDDGCLERRIVVSVRKHGPNIGGAQPGDGSLRAVRPGLNCASAG